MFPPYNRPMIRIFLFLTLILVLIKGVPAFAQSGAEEISADLSLLELESEDKDDVGEIGGVEGGIAESEAEIQRREKELQELAALEEGDESPEARGGEKRGDGQVETSKELEASESQWEQEFQDVDDIDIEGAKSTQVPDRNQEVSGSAPLYQQ